MIVAVLLLLLATAFLRRMFELHLELVEKVERELAPRRSR